MKAILILVMLALAALAIPSTSAALPASCSLGPVTPGGDTDCRASYGGCEVHAHVYDVEDALNQYEADCWGCGVHYGAGPLVRGDCYTPPPIAASGASPVETRCSSSTEVSVCNTDVLGVCTYTTFTQGEVSSSWLGCSTSATGYCHIGVTPVQNPTVIWCEDYGPGEESSASAAALAPPCHRNASNDLVCHAQVGGCTADTYMYDMEDAVNHYKAHCGCVHVDNYGRPAVRLDCIDPPPDPVLASAAVAPPDPSDLLPCQSTINGFACGTGALSCSAVAGYVTGSEQYEFARLYCGPPTWSPCEHLYADTTGEVRNCFLAFPDTSAPAAEFPPQVCINGMAQTWCDFTVGPCDVRVTPWTAWGDQYVVADCRGGGAGPTCHTEVHTEGPLAHQHYCAW